MTWACLLLGLGCLGLIPHAVIRRYRRRQAKEKLADQWQLLKTQVGEALVPALTDLAEEFGHIIKEINELDEDL